MKGHGARDREQHDRRLRDEDQRTDPDLQEEHRGDHGPGRDAVGDAAKDRRAREGGDRVDPAVRDREQEVPGLVEAVGIAGDEAEPVPQDRGAEGREERQQKQRSQRRWAGCRAGNGVSVVVEGRGHRPG